MSIATDIKKARLWRLFAVGVILRVIPEFVRHQHRAGDIVLWVSSFPRG
jgi:hypothetical protein